MDIRKVKKLIELLEESGIAEIEIKEGEEAVRISRMPTGGFVTHMQAPMMQGMMTSYIEQSKNMFVQMQEQMQTQAKSMFSTFPFNKQPNPEPEKK